MLHVTLISRSLKKPFHIRTGSIFSLEKLHMIEMVGVKIRPVSFIGGGREGEYSRFENRFFAFQI
jgi:hypothetical protein